jgi:F-type H+-transporting ATPase subunit b
MAARIASGIEAMATPANTTAGTTAQGKSPASGAFPPFQTETFASQLLWLALAFGLLYWMMAKIIVPRIGGIIADRSSRINADLDSAATAKSKAEEAGAAYEKSLVEARARAQTIAQTTRDSVNAASDTRRKAVEGELAAKLAASESRIVKMKDKAMANVDGIAAETAISIVQKLTGISPTTAAAAAAVKSLTKG